MNDIIELQSLSNQGSLSTEEFAQVTTQKIVAIPFQSGQSFDYVCDQELLLAARSQSLSNQGCLSTLLFQKYFIFINEMRQCPIRAKK